MLEEFASDVGLDVNKEEDLVELAQFYFNSKGGNRHGLSQKILAEFTKDLTATDNLKILTRLPIYDYWTTNYDKLIEETLKVQRRKPDVKSRENHLAQNLPGRDAIVYKMHGDVDTPEETVLIKDDYEAYNMTRQLFTTNLQGDLISKTFLFIGFSFEDPNLNFILSKIRILLGANKREHYCFFRRIQEKDCESSEDFQYKKTKQDLKIDDLQRYSINAVLVNEYNEIDQILNEIYDIYQLDNIFISGSAATYEPFKIEEGQNLVYQLTENLVKNDFKIINGFGSGIGDFVINGALHAIFDSPFKKMKDYLELRPFPQTNIEKEQRKEYREDMISEAGIVIFLFGNKQENESIINAKGVIQEFEIAKQQNKFIIPIGSTGYASKKILEEVEANINEYAYLEESIELLTTSSDAQEINKEIIKISKKLKENNYG